MIDNRTIAILMELFANQKMSLYELSVQTGIDKEQLRHRLDEVNQLLEEQDFPRLDLQDAFYQVPAELLEQSQYLLELFRSRQIYLSQEERLVLIYLYTFIRKDFISNIHYQDLLSVSRNTTLADIKKVKDLSVRFGVSFDYTRKRGYHLNGHEKDKHRLVLYAISKCLQTSIGVWALDYILRAWQEDNAIDVLKKASQQACYFYQVSALEDRLDEYLYFLQFLAIRQERVQISMDWEVTATFAFLKEFVQQLWSLLQLKKDVIGSLSVAQIDYLAQLLQGCLEGRLEQKDSLFSQLTLEIVEEMERLSLIAFDNRLEMIEGLERHLIPAYYRLTSQLVNVNSYTEVIKEEHKDLFHLVQKALAPLERYLGFAIPDSEVSYFVIHFWGYIEAKKDHAFRYRALVVCPNGVSSSLIVKENIRQLFPNISFADTHSLKEFRQIEQSDYDMIFATVKLDTELPFFLVPQLMTARQKKDLFQLVTERFPNASYFPIEIEQLLAVIGKYATIHHEQSLKYELVQFMNQKSYEKRRRSPMLGELLTQETFSCSSDQLSWQEAIALAAQPLIANGAVEEGYATAMIQKVEEFGPFIDLGKGVAIPHARPEDGVNRIGMSLLVLENPVYLLDDPKHEIRLFICIAAIDNQTHLKALSGLTAILRKEENIQQLIEAKCFDDIADLIKEVS
ncbi:BglG family transcription antiterminator [Streptococcus sciuri]|uniref:Ascorbate-specific PTS system EIIA component n=1 Tax=Streptococcus sciuri TaxID=2973939 RepID=A0ABT2F7U9_9STRE|nr:BglG family transcription antiterminator [Streptococcus sciuri]MCS4488499.1 BglG family transcription antiterminator [Streptococcus sciuri]